MIPKGNAPAQEKKGQRRRLRSASCLHAPVSNNDLFALVGLLKRLFSFGNKDEKKQAVVGTPTNFVHRHHIGFDPDKGFDVRDPYHRVHPCNACRLFNVGLNSFVDVQYSSGVERALQSRWCYKEGPQES